MWGRDFLRDGACVLALALSLVTCFIIVASSWPAKREARTLARADDIPHVIRSTAIEGAEIVPAVSKTGSIRQVSERDPREKP